MFEGLSNYSYPPKGVELVKQSVVNHYLKIVVPKIDEAKILNQPHVLRERMSFYPTSRIPEFCAENFDKEECFNALNDLFDAGCINLKSTPGYPYSLLYQSNGDLEQDLICADAANLLEIWSKCDYDSIMQMNSQQLMENGINDMIYVFPKLEVTKKKKLNREDYMSRIINALSARMMLIGKILINNQDNVEKYVYHAIPSQPGMGQTEEDFKYFHREVVLKIREGLAMYHSDNSHFDITQCYDVIMANAHLRCALNGAMPGSLYWRLIHIYYHCITTIMLVFKDGEIWSQIQSGTMRSGQPGTAQDNSRTKTGTDLAAKHYFNSKIPVFSKTMGDDSVGVIYAPTWNDQAQFYRDCGYAIKGAQIIDKYEFISREFDVRDINCNPPSTNESKSLYALLTNEPSQQTVPRFCQWIMDMRHNHELLQRVFENFHKLEYGNQSVRSQILCLIKQYDIKNTTIPKQISSLARTVKDTEISY